MNTTAFLIVGSVTSVDDVLQLPAQTIVVNNYSNQWVELPGITQFVPPYWVGATYPGYGTNRQTAKFNSPTGIPQAATIAAQTCVVLWLDLALPPNPGQPITVRAPNTEWRNPKGLVFSSGGVVAAGPTGNVLDWSYTVPAGRRARLDDCQVVGELTISDGTGGASLAVQAEVVYFPLGGAGVQLINAIIFNGTVVGARADVAIASGKELQATDIVQGIHNNARGAGVSQFSLETAVITEGDA